MNTEIKVLQINLGHRILAHDALMAWLASQRHEVIVCIQEPYFSKKGITKLPNEYGAYWIESTANKSRRAIVIAPRRLNGYMVTQHSSEDCVTVRFERQHSTTLDK